MNDIAKIPAQDVAIDLYVNNPNITHKEVCETLGISEKVLLNWRKDANFVEKFYKRYTAEVGMYLPAVMKAMINEALQGNVQAGRLVLESQGKMDKNVNVNILSPYDKWLNSKQIPTTEFEEAEFVEEMDKALPEVELPERREEDPKVRTKEENKKVEEIIKTDRVSKMQAKNRNIKRREAYKWAKRAKAVGIEQLKGGRASKGQRKAWQQKVIEAEANQQ
tara:strand:+ start:356 stop:1018 length:663 start_codon:yes stop_codon:yes gene_type:complete